MALPVALSASAAGAQQARDVATGPGEPWMAGAAGWLATPLAVAALAAAVAAAALCFSACTARRAHKRTEAALRENLRARDSLHAAFIATEDMDRPLSVVLAELAEAIRKGMSRPDEARIHLTLPGAQRDEIGATSPLCSITRPIPHIPAGSGQITVAYPTTDDRARGPSPFTPAEEDTLTLIASRIGGRMLGMLTQRDLRRNEEVFREANNQQAIATLAIVDRHVTEANAAAARILGYDSPGDLRGKSPLDLSPPVQPDGQDSAAAADALLSRMEALEPCRFEWEHRRADGTPVLVDVQTVSARDESGRPVIYLMWNDITVRRHAEAVLAAYQRTLEAQVALRTEELSRLYDELRAIVSTAGSGIALVRDATIVNANPALARKLGIDEDTLQGRSSRSIFPGQAEWERVLEQADAALSQGRPFEVEREFLRADGSSFWGRLRAAAVDAGDPARGAVWVLDDITPDRTARHELAQAREIAEQAVQLKSNFLAEMSHEIRSPINAVLGFTEMLLNTPLTGLQLEYLGKVQASGRHLLMIINDILDLSKAEAGKMRIEATEFDLVHTLHAAVDSVAQAAADKDVELVVDTDPALPARFMGDPLRVTQILINLLSNAVKFTDRGTILLSVAPDLNAGARAGLCFTVADTGVGMTPEQVHRLFQPFTQAEDSTARLFGGTGLGLSICKQIVSLMGGDIGVTSTKGTGSRFWFTLPLQPVSDDPVPATSATLAGRRALVVDDHDAARDLTARHLAGAGLAVDTVSSTDAAIDHAGRAQAEGRPFDVILIDRKMRGVTGIDSARHLRALHGGARILILSTHGGQDLLDLIATEGMDGMVPKPVFADDLLRRVAEALAREPAHPRRRKPPPRKAGTRPPAPQDASVAASTDTGAWDGLRALVVDDNTINRDLAIAMLENCGFAVQGAANGAEALEAVLRQDFDVVLIDGQMPVMDGFEAARRIRALPTAKGKVPIIGLTGQGGDDDRDTGLQAGMNAYLVKPVRMADLRAALERWLPRSGGKG